MKERPHRVLCKKEIYETEKFKKTWLNQEEKKNNNSSTINTIANSKKENCKKNNKIKLEKKALNMTIRRNKKKKFCTVQVKWMHWNFLEEYNSVGWRSCVTILSSVVKLLYLHHYLQKVVPWIIY